MLRGLKVAMIVYGVIIIIFGLGFAIIPEQLLDMFGFAERPAYMPYFLGLLGISFIAPSVFIISAARDPIRHINWVKFAITWSLTGLAVEVYAMLRGFVDFSQAGTGTVIDAVSAVALLILYPWGATRGVQETK